MKFEPNVGIPLSELPCKFKGTVVKISDELTACKLMCMGLMPGCEIELLRCMPFKGSFYLRLRGHQIALRHSEAAAIFVQPLQVG